MKRIIYVLAILLLIIPPLMSDYYSYKGKNWKEFYGYHGWKSVYKYEGWRTVYRYESWRDTYGYYGWRDVYLKKEEKRDVFLHPFPRFCLKEGTHGPYIFYGCFIFCIR